MPEIKCPVCHTEFTNPFVMPTRFPDGEVWKSYKCPVCGPFFITVTEAMNLRDGQSYFMLSAWIREHQEFKVAPPQITNNVLKNILKNLREYKVSEKQLLLLRAVERRAEHSGSRVRIGENDYPLVWAKNYEELSYLCAALAERNLIYLGTGGKTGERFCDVTIRSDGWDYLDKYSISPAFKNQAFVAMSFDKALDSIYKNGVKPAIEKAGYKPHRVDKEPHIDRIDAKIIANIKDSLFMIADVTQQKQGVYFEAGYALALNRPVIWCVKEDDLENLHFDTRQFNHIIWKTPEDLQEQLYDVICAVIGKRTREEN